MGNNLHQRDKKDSSKVPQPMGQKLSHEAVFMSLSKKAEKISTALYMITDFIDTRDPIRQRMRQSGIDLITHTRQMSHAFSGDIYFMIARAINTAWELISLIEVASSVGFVSDMNARVLRSVLVEFISALRDKQRREGFSTIEDLKIGESLSDQISLSKSLFDVKEVLYKGLPVKDSNMSFTKKEVFSMKPQPVDIAKISQVNSMAPQKKSERRDKILEIIKQKKEVMIGDISIDFPDISSKTIQRELLSLVEENVLKKEGEKRWSRYSLQSSGL